MRIITHIHCSRLVVFFIGGVASNEFANDEMTNR